MSLPRLHIKRSYSIHTCTHCEWTPERHSYAFSFRMRTFWSEFLQCLLTSCRTTWSYASTQRAFIQTTSPSGAAPACCGRGRRVVTRCTISFTSIRRSIKRCAPMGPVFTLHLLFISRVIFQFCFVVKCLFFIFYKCTLGSNDVFYGRRR